MFLMQDRSGEPVVRLIEEFLTDRATRKPSPHTVQAYRRDLRTVASIAADEASPPLPLDALPLEALRPRVLRSAFAHFAATRSAASVHRAWSTWNSFFVFLVADGVVAGNPMPAVGARGHRCPGPSHYAGQTPPSSS